MPIVLTNASTVVPDADVKALVPALQTQIDRDYYPIWRSRANVLFVPKNGLIPRAAWVVAILDDSTVAGALGFHDLTSAGMPLSKVFAKDDLKYGAKLSVTVSHEVLEMIADPWCSLNVFNQTSDTAGTIVPWEVCDACEADNLGYDIGGVTVSDFVTPAYFDPTRPAGTRFDYGGHIAAPLAIAPGGYQSRFTVPGGSWHQVDARGQVTPVDPHDARYKPRSTWTKSTAV